MRIEPKRIIIFLYVTTGSTIISTAILHATYTNIFPILAQFSMIFLFISAFFIGVLIPDFKDALYAMFLSIFSTLVIMAIIRSIPAFIGIITSNVTFFIISQFALSIPIIFPLIMVYSLGLLAGLILSVFAFDPYTKDL
ncbi:MAG: hypothetical protein ACXADB_04285 [Candidatus Hermodarchaeia archaeon]